MGINNLKEQRAFIERKYCTSIDEYSFYFFPIFRINIIENNTFDDYNKSR